MDDTLPAPSPEPSDPHAQTVAGKRSAAVGTAAMFGRYLVLGRLGRGGMGEVFTAYDPELDRKIALKRVRIADRARDDRRARLLDEAKAMAKIRHPNVVAVFDVGQLDLEVFIAMELVDGETLRAWMGRPQAPLAIVEVFMQAAQGLAAAHDCGLVHRDFKPDNAMIDRAGRVQVLDFGLAATLGDGAGQTDGSYAAGGTPAYMPPEQYAGESPSALGDQFALCVAMFEALHGRRPFVGDSLAELAAAVGRGEISEPTDPRRIPRWIDRAVRRGLAVRPADRWPSMQALHGALASGLASRRRGRNGLVAVALVGVAAGAVALQVATRPSCDDASAAVDAVWNDDARDPAAQAFTQAGALGRDGWPMIATAIDARADGWRAAYREACEAATAGGRAEIELADRQRVCLHGQLQRLQGALDVLAAADAEVVEQAPFLVSALPMPGECAAPPPADVIVEGSPREQRRRIAAIAESLLVAGKPALARERIDAIAAEVQGDPASHAELGVLAARAARQLGERERSVALLDDAYLAARQTGDRGLTLAAAREFVASHVERQEPAEALRWIARARVEAEALGDARTLATLRGREAQAMSHLGDYEGAIAMGKAALAELEALDLGASKDALDVVTNLGGYYYFLRDYDRALAYKREALTRFAGLLDARHPITAKLIGDLGVIAMAKGDLDDAKKYLEQSLAIVEAAYDEPNQAIGENFASLAGLALRQGDEAGAVAYSERALANFRPTQGEHSTRVALVLNNYSLALREAGRHADAVAALRASIEIKEDLLAADHPDLALAYTNLAALIATDGDDAAVRAYYERALTIRSKRDEPEPLAVLRARYAEWLVEHGDRETARTLAEQALASSSVPEISRKIATAVLEKLGAADVRSARPTPRVAP